MPRNYIDTKLYQLISPHLSLNHVVHTKSCIDNMILHLLVPKLLYGTNTESANGYTMSLMNIKCAHQHMKVIMRHFNSFSYIITLNVTDGTTVYPKKYAHGFVVLCFIVVMQSFIMNSHEVFTHIHQGCFAGTGAIVRLLQCQWSKPDGYGKISQCITTTKHSKAKSVCIFLVIYCSNDSQLFQCCKESVRKLGTQVNNNTYIVLTHCGRAKNGCHFAEDNFNENI